MANAIMPPSSGAERLFFFSAVSTEENTIRAVEDQTFPGAWTELTWPCSVAFPHSCSGLVSHAVF